MNEWVRIGTRGPVARGVHMVTHGGIELVYTGKNDLPSADPFVHHTNADSSGSMYFEERVTFAEWEILKIGLPSEEEIQAVLLVRQLESAGIISMWER